MTKKYRLNEESLLALFDYNLFSPSEKLERLAKESLDRVDSRQNSHEPPKMLPPLNLESLDSLSAAGSSNQTELPPELK